MRNSFLLLVSTLLFCSCASVQKAMVDQAEYDMRRGNLIAAERRSTLSYGMASRCGDERVMGDALFVMIGIDCQDRDLNTAEEKERLLSMCAEAIEHYRKANLPSGVAIVLYKRATLYYGWDMKDMACDDLSASLEAYEEGLKLDPDTVIPIYVEGVPNFREIIRICREQMGCTANGAPVPAQPEATADKSVVSPTPTK